MHVQYINWKRRHFYAIEAKKGHYLFKRRVASLNLVPRAYRLYFKLF